MGREKRSWLQRSADWGWLALALVLGLAALFESVKRLNPPPQDVAPAAGRLRQLAAGSVASMDSSLFHYSPGWQVSAAGADPSEPADPEIKPAGIVTFTYTGAELALNLAVGDYWGYLYVTVDGVPANLLPASAHNRNSLGELAGYKPLYAPERQIGEQPTTQWVRVHRAAKMDQQHQVRLELWRSWGQTPLRAVAVDRLPPPTARWPAIALIVAAVWCGVLAVKQGGRGERIWFVLRARLSIPATVARRLALVFYPIFPIWRPMSSLILSIGLGGAAVILISYGIWGDVWQVTLVGLGLLALVGLRQPAVWVAALLFALPFYFRFPLPLLPERSLNLVEIGVWGGLALLIAQRALQVFAPVTPAAVTSERPQPMFGGWQLSDWLLAGIVSWALIVCFTAQYSDLAIREWRTVFLSAGLFYLVLVWLWQTLWHTPWQMPATQQVERSFVVWTPIWAWLLGATVVAGIGIYGYLWRVDSLTIPAEGVLRVRAFYGSPNNLALYLERTLAVCSALFLFETSVWRRWLALLLAGPQAVALLLTFSKGTFVLGAPALIFTLAVVGWTFLWRQGRSRCLLWWLALAGGAGLLVLTPVSGAERFRSLLDFGQGTSFLRINLWRSAWQMAFDHPLFGVGPDQFLYHFRSGYILPAAWREPDLNHPHNWLLDWWTRLGLPGLALGFGWWLTLIRQGVHWAWTEVNSPSDNALSALRIGVLAALASSLTHGLIDQSYALPDLMLTWVLCAALLRRPCREMLLEQGYLV